MSRSYDIFLSFKNRDAAGQPTPDSQLARALHDHFAALGLSVFFSNVSLEQLGTAAWMRAINEALESARIMVAVGTSRQNLESRWVEYEWSGFISDMLGGAKPAGRVFSYVQDMPPNSLPRALRQYTVTHGPNSLTQIANYVLNGLDKPAIAAASLPPTAPPPQPPSVLPTLVTPKRKAGDIITNSLGMKLAWIPPSKFLMGSPDKEPERGKDERQHEVEITRGFYLGVHPVTQEEYAKVMKATPSYFGSTGDGKEKVAGMDTKRFPVEQVSWRDALEFCRRLGELEPGKNYDLPTEAEWEYACRAGTVSAFSFGANLSSRQANFNQGLGRTCAVGAYPANAFGLFDMHGNVWEWCKDCYDAAYYDKSPSSDPECTQGENRVLRGGSWDGRAGGCRCAFRYYLTPDGRDGGFGFRVVLSCPEDSL